MNLRRIEAFVLIGLGWHKECSVPNLCIEIRDNDHQVRNEVRQVSLPIDPDTTTNRSFSIIRKLFAARVANATSASKAERSSDQDNNGPDRNLEGRRQGRPGKMR
jgi:hypothetical protein